MTVLIAAGILAGILFVLSHRAGLRGDHGMAGDAGSTAVLVLIIACAYLLSGCAPPGPTVPGGWVYDPAYTSAPPRAPTPPPPSDPLEFLAGLAGAILQGFLNH